MLNVYYQVFISVLPPLKLKIRPLNLNIAGPSKAKNLTFLLVYVNENFKNRSVVDVQLIQDLSYVRKSKCNSKSKHKCNSKIHKKR